VFRCFDFSLFQNSVFFPGLEGAIELRDKFQFLPLLAL
jgi:hypothetical protein